MTRGLLFFAPGTPVQQGSKNYGVTKDGRAYGWEAAGDRLTKWRRHVSACAIEAMDGAKMPYLQGPIAVDALCYYEPLKSAPDREWKISAPDVDKLARAGLDSLTGYVYHDDKQVADLRIWKKYAHGDIEPGVWFVLMELNER